MYPDPFGLIHCGDLMLFLQAYFDESGKASEQDVASFCGFVAESHHWRKCWDTWGVLLYDAGLPELKAQKALRYRSDLSAKCPARGIEPRVAALTPFVRAIRDNLAFGIAVTVDCKAFRGLPEADRQALKNDPHYWAFQQALLLINRCAGERFPNDHPDIQIGLCCDEEEKTSVECLKIFTNLRRTYPELRKRFVSIGFGDDRYFSQLQAADLIASIARQEAGYRFHGAPFDMRPMFDLLCARDPQRPNSAPVVFSFMDGDLLSGVARAEREGQKARRKTM